MVKNYNLNRNRSSGFGFQKCFSRNFQFHRRDPNERMDFLRLLLWCLFFKLESEYVKNHLEGVLTELLAELYLIRPADPIEWLSCALRQYARREEARKGRSEPSEAADGTALTTE